MKKTFFSSFLCLFLASAAPAQHGLLTWKTMRIISPGLEQIGTVATDDMLY